MNFKTFCLSALALLSAVNAAPVEDNANASYIEKVKAACRHGSGELFYKMNTDESTTYACISKFNPQRKNNMATPDNSACYYYEDNVYCVDKRYTNIKQCNKSKNEFDYRTCSFNVISLTNESSKVSTSQFKTYPDNERIRIDYVQDQNDCRARGGIVLTYKVMQQYICLYPENITHSLKDKHCVKVDGKVYCIYEDNTIIDTCNKHSKHYNHDSCMGAISEYARANGITVDEEGF